LTLVLGDIGVGCAGRQFPGVRLASRATPERGVMRAKHPVGVLVVGLDNSGKTTVVDWLANMSTRSTGNHANEANVTVPTVGFTARRLKFGATPITVLDMSGQVSYKLRPTEFLFCNFTRHLLSGVAAWRSGNGVGRIN